MPNPIVKPIMAATGASIGTALAEGLTSPKAVGLFYINVAKSCYGATESKRVACAVALGACGIAVVPGPHQAPFIVGCLSILRGVDKV